MQCEVPLFRGVEDERFKEAKAVVEGDNCFAVSLGSGTTNTIMMKNEL